MSEIKTPLDEFFKSFAIDLEIEADKIDLEILVKIGIENVFGDYLEQQINHDSKSVVPSACYHLYHRLSGTEVGNESFYKVLSNCTRYEEEESPLRLKNFKMVELVCIGGYDETKVFYESIAEKFKVWCKEEFCIELSIVEARDSFIGSGAQEEVERKNALAKHMVSLFSPKLELQIDGVAVASCNLHNKFFTEKFNIYSASDQLATSACFAVGIERFNHFVLK